MTYSKAFNKGELRKQNYRFEPMRMKYSGIAVSSLGGKTQGMIPVSLHNGVTSSPPPSPPH